MRVFRSILRFWRDIKIPEDKQKYALIAILALLYMYQYILRVVPGMTMDILIGEFALKTVDFTDLGADYLCVYALMQIPMLYIIDSFGIKKVFISAIIICLTGLLLIAYSSSLIFLKVSRVMHAFASSGIFVGALKVIMSHVKKDRQSLCMGLVVACGCLGAVIAGIPLNKAIIAFGISGAVWMSIILGIFLIMALSKLEISEDVEYINFADFCKNLHSTVNAVRILLYAAVATGFYLPICVFADIWCTGFIMLKYEVSRMVALQTSWVIYFGLCCGAVIIPSLLEEYFKVAIKYILMALALVFYVVIFYQDASVVQTCLFLVGFLCGAHLLCFKVLLTGTISDATIKCCVLNSLITIFGAVLQQMVGGILSVKSNSENLFLLSDYVHGNFVVALSILLFFMAVSLLISFALKNEKI